MGGVVCWTRAFLFLWDLGDIASVHYFVTTAEPTHACTIMGRACHKHMNLGAYRIRLSGDV